MTTLSTLFFLSQLKGFNLFSLFKLYFHKHSKNTTVNFCEWFSEVVGGICTTDVKDADMVFFEKKEVVTYEQDKKNQKASTTG